MGDGEPTIRAVGSATRRRANQRERVLATTLEKRVALGRTAPKGYSVCHSHVGRLREHCQSPREARLEIRPAPTITRVSRGGPVTRSVHAGLRTDSYPAH